MGFTGMHCELELLASGVLTPSRDFIVALALCLGTLIRKYRPQTHRGVVESEG